MFVVGEGQGPARSDCHQWHLPCYREGTGAPPFTGRHSQRSARARN
jgi:hypothetical protein